MKKIALLIFLVLLCGCGRKTAEVPGQIQKTGSMDLKYAKEFTVDYYGDALARIQIEDRVYWFSQDGSEIASELSGNDTVISGLPEHIYLASSASMDHFRRLGELDRVAMTSTMYADWSIPEIRELVYEDEISFVGKYSAPDIEYILSEECDLAIENTMIFHSPDILEELERVGIPVLVERSSREQDPLGRLEWIKLYGLLSGKLPEAEQFFAESEKQILKMQETAETTEGDKPKAAYFYVTGQGGINVRAEDDYVIHMLKAAGADYVPKNLPEGTSRAYITIDAENFYAQVHDADILIYNGVIGDGIRTKEELIAMNSLLADFDAVRSGRVWITDNSLLQESTGIADAVQDFRTILEGGEELKYLTKIE